MLFWGYYLNKLRQCVTTLSVIQSFCLIINGKTLLMMPLFIPHVKMSFSLLVWCVVLRWIRKMGQLPFFCECFVKYAAELNQGLAALSHIAYNKHFVLFWVKAWAEWSHPASGSHEPGFFLVFLSDWCCSFSWRLPLPGTPSAPLKSPVLVLK